MVNPAITAVLIAASRQEEVEQRIEGRLRKAAALSATTAIALSLDEKDQPLLDQALASGTVKETANGRYYLDEHGIADRNEGQGFVALLILLVVGSILASLIVLVGFSGN
jgi:hypothetical protein